MIKQGGKLFLILTLIGLGFFCFLSTEASELININTASLEELDTLPGIGEVKAQAIIDYREANGFFSSIGEIVNVSGIGAVTYENIKDLITVGEQTLAECGDGVLDAGEECDDGNNTSGDGCSANCAIENLTPTPSPTEGEGSNTPPAPSLEGIASFSLGDVVINEFVSDPTDGEVEWLELYNTLGQEINLAGWTIEEGSGAKTSLDGVIGSTGSVRFFIIEEPKGNLNNKGDIIILRDANSNLIDQVVYGAWDDGDIGDNAPMASDPKATARKLNGLNSYNNTNDFAITTTPTKGTSNIITLIVEEISEQDKENYDYSNDIIISEIFPNPAGDDSEGEFIELYNSGGRAVDLTGWRLGDNSKRKYELEEIITNSNGIATPPIASGARNDNTIKAGEYLVIYRSESRIALNNSSDSVKLFQPLVDEPLQTVEYEKVIEGWSLGIADFRLLIVDLSNYVWSETVTPGKENIINTINHPPEVFFDFPEEILIGVPVIFDSSDTVDEGGDELEFSWDFGDGIKLTLPLPEHTYFKAGAYTVKLVVSDGENKVIKEEIIRVADRQLSSFGNHGIASPMARNDSVVINEVLPNPAGIDKEGEWVEVKNAGDIKINLLNWAIDDGEGGSRPYKFGSDVWLEAGEFFTLDRVDSGLALNNSVDAVRLYNDYEELIDEIEYGKVVEGESYARGENGKLFWTTVLTPGSENIISVAGSRAVKQIDGTIAKNISSQTSKNKVKVITETTLEKIKEFESGELVKVAGVVAVKPGVLGSQYFYIVTPHPLTPSPSKGEGNLEERVKKEVIKDLIFTAGIQVYNYKKEFPPLKIGDYVEVNGELAVSSGEMRIKTKIADDMKIIEQRDAPVAEAFDCDKINEETIGALITVTGEVVERKSSIIYLDDGTDEVIVYIKKATGINPKSIEEGEILEVTGIVGRTKSGIRIMPRSTDDIIKKDIESQARQAGQVLGEVAISDEWAIAGQNKKIKLFKYLLVIAMAVIVVLAGLLVKSVRRG